MMDIIQIVLLLLLGFPLAYLAFLSALAFIAPRRHSQVAVLFRRFAVVVPAHDEESSIAETVQSLRSVWYPPSRFDVAVIADNCSDRTAERARAEGAVVLERTSAEERGKGYALQWAFGRLLQEGYEAFVVCDADTVVSRNLLIEVNGALERGAMACQCNDQVRPSPDSWSAEATRAGFLLYNYVRPLGRSMFGGSAGLRGNGMAFAADTLRQIPWQAFSRAEDLEYGLVLLLNGIRVWFVPDAHVLATMPTDARNAESQRARWESGRFPIVRRFAWPLLNGAIREGSFRLLDAWIDLLTPPFVNVMTWVAGMIALNAVLWAFGVTQTPLFILLWGAVALMGLFHALVGFAAAGTLGDVMGLLRHVPRYATWKIGLYLRLFTGGDTSRWVRTTREAPSFQKEP